MRTDYHLHVTYVLARKAGLNPEMAGLLAHVSELVDDAKDNKTITFSNGGQIKPIRSAHKMISPYFMTDRTGMAIYMPFHFFPSCEGQTFRQKITCKPQSTGLDHLKKEVLKALNKPYGPYWLGILLHIIADTYAHQNFVALNDPVNQAKVLAVDNHHVLDITLILTSRLYPPFGHMQVLTLPDEPALKWSYKDACHKVHHRHNPTDFMRASHEIYDLINTPVRQAKPTWYTDDAKEDFSAFNDQLSQMLNLNMPLKDRLHMWDRTMNLDLFKDVTYNAYKPEAWYKEAIHTIGRGLFKKHTRLPDYERSHWKLFQNALAHHVFYCKHDLFPQFGIHI